MILLLRLSRSVPNTGLMVVLLPLCYTHRPPQPCFHNHPDHSCAPGLPLPSEPLGVPRKPTFSSKACSTNIARALLTWWTRQSQQPGHSRQMLALRPPYPILKAYKYAVYTVCWPTCPFTMCKWPAQLQLYSRGSTLGTASSQSLWPKGKCVRLQFVIYGRAKNTHNYHRSPSN